MLNSKLFKKVCVLSMVGLFSLSFVGCSSKEVASNPEGNSVATNVVAEKADKKVVLLFESENCSACQSQKPIWEEVVENKEYAENYTFYTVSVDDPLNDDILTFYGVEKIPNLVISGINGEQLYQSAGVHTAEEIYDELNEKLSY